MQLTILSIQSHVAYGHVGNAAATFPMQRLGVEVMPLHTVQFSNHTGYGEWTGRVFDGAMIEELMKGIAARGALEACDAVLSGYMGSVEIGHAILGAAGRVKIANGNAIYACDPVIGDVGRGIFVKPGLPEFIRSQVVPSARLITPNHFELDYLTGRQTSDHAELKRALAELHRSGPATILVTSYQGADTPADGVDLLASTMEGLWRVRTPKLAISVNGAGDAIAALFLVHFLKTGSAASALQAASSSIYGLLKLTAEAGARELQLVAAQEEYVRPSRIFAVEKI